MLPLSEKFVDYAAEVEVKLKAARPRTSVDHSNEKLGAKIRGAQMQKVPFMLVVGEKDAGAGTVALRRRTGGDQPTLTVDELIAMAKEAGLALAVLPLRSALVPAELPTQTLLDAVLTAYIACVIALMMHTLVRRHRPS